MRMRCKKRGVRFNNDTIERCGAHDLAQRVILWISDNSCEREHKPQIQKLLPFNRIAAKTVGHSVRKLVLF